MDRLICGDVGFGKTEVAIRAAFKATCDNKQVAVMVPTTVLAFQHYQTFSERLREFPVKVEYLSRARKPKEVRRILDELKEGKVDIIIKLVKSRQGCKMRAVSVKLQMIIKSVFNVFKSWYVIKILAIKD